MDLNHFYSQHQVALIRASAATDRLARSRHLADAALIGEQIRYHQFSKGAAAAWSWRAARSEEHTSELQSLMRISYAVFCVNKKIHITPTHQTLKRRLYT